MTPQLRYLVSLLLAVDGYTLVTAPTPVFKAALAEALRRIGRDWQEALAA